MTVLLGFICKNEEHVVERMITSCAPYIEEVYALDTGSSDATVATIKRVCRSLDLPCRVDRAKWTDFADMRTRMMIGARKWSQADWMLQMDADWELIVADNTPRPFDVLDSNSSVMAYGLSIYDSGNEWDLPKITRMSHPWRYQNVVHETLTDGDLHGSIGPAIVGVTALHHNDGGSRAGRHARDVEMLRGKTDTRSMFYFAQSLHAVQRYDEALDAYLARAARTDGYDEERYFSLFMAGRCAKELGQTDRAVGLLLRAWGLRSQRLEALCTALEIFRETQQWQLAYIFGGTAVSIAREGKALVTDSLFLEKWRWDWGAKWEYLSACAAVGNTRQAVVGWKALLDQDILPAGYREATLSNLEMLKEQNTV